MTVLRLYNRWRYTRFKLASGRRSRVVDSTVEAGSKPEFEFGKGINGILFILLIKNWVIYSLNSNNTDRSNIIV